ncbi:MAG: cytochrome d ubiquinol oxidase subunit II [Acidobacteriota bacterium]
MEVFWLAIVSVMIAAYVVFDGFDLGAGALHLFVARTEAERQTVIRSVGPVWDGNEVWLLAAGGTLYFAFPALYASSFSGFYLPLMIVLWLLILRGISIELRNHIDTPVWRPFWDVVLCGASGLLAIFFGAALGNVVRGVPLEPSGYFFLPLWTDFGFGQAGLHAVEGGILDWYTILVALLAFLTLLEHGARWLILKTTGPVRDRSRMAANRTWWVLLVFVVVVTLVTFRIQPQVLDNFAAAPWGLVFPALALLGLAGMPLLRGERRELHAFLASCLFIVGMLTSAVFGIFPFLLPSSTNPDLGLTVYNVATSDYGMMVGLAWWIPGIILVATYFVYTYRRFSGKVNLEEAGY